MFKKYKNPEIQQEIEEKGFCVYKYLDKKELFLSIKKDYIHELWLMYWVFLWIFVIAWIIFWKTNGVNLIYFWVFGILYGYIFLRMCIRLYKRTKIFLKNSSIIYTPHALILNKQIYTQESDPDFLKHIQQIEEAFHESPGQESLLYIKTKEIEKDLFSQMKKSFRGLWKVRWWPAMALIVMFNVIFLAIYYIGYVLFFAFFLLYAGIISFLLTVQKTPQHRINDALLAIQKHINGMNKQRLSIEHAIEHFINKENINISKSIETHLPPFYRRASYAIESKKKLFSLIEHSEFWHIIDTHLLNNYLKNQVNMPIRMMIQILSQTHTQLKQALTDTHTLLQTPDQEYTLSGNLQLKLRTLEHQDNLILNHIGKLKQSLL